VGYSGVVNSLAGFCLLFLSGQCFAFSDIVCIFVGDERGWWNADDTDGADWRG